MRKYRREYEISSREDAQSVAKSVQERLDRTGRPISLSFFDTGVWRMTALQEGWMLESE
jgi:hypothetical protein